MKVLVTGAGGFLGRMVAEAAQRAGHEVVAMQRPASAAPMADGITVLAGDLRQPGEWSEGLSGVDAVVHCAASFGDLTEQLAGTVLGTETLLAALPDSVFRIVHVSSFSVYDFDAPPWGGSLNESTPLEHDPLRRDAYTQTKMIQERLVRDHAERKGLELVVVRPGAIYGPGKDWDYGRAMRVGPIDLIFAPFTPMRLIHVDNCADAIVAALSTPVSEPLTVNLVDHEQPGHWQYHRLARKSGVPLGIGLPLPYWTVKALGSAARLASRMFFEGRARLPELLDSPRQRVRWRPLHYSNIKARVELGWEQRVTLEEGLAQLAESESQHPRLGESPSSSRS